MEGTIPYSEIILFTIILAQQVQLILSRGISASREDRLTQAIMSKNLPEYIQSLETPKDNVKRLKSEIKLAGKATALEKRLAKNSGTMDDLPVNAYPVR